MNGRLVSCTLNVMVYDEPITIKTKNGESKVKAEIIGCTTLIRPMLDEVTKQPTGKNKFLTSVPLFNSETGEKVVNLPLSGKNIFAPREYVNDGVKAAAVAGAK